MPSRAERTAIRWLLRAALLGTIGLAVWGTLAANYRPQSQVPQPATSSVASVPVTGEKDNTKGSTEGSTEGRGNALVVVSLKGENVDWLDGVLDGWERNVYVADGAALEEGAELGIPRNKGREGMVYLSFIIDNYAHLPAITLFLHSARYQWHNDDPAYDGLPPLRNLRLAHVSAAGYANLRCAWTLGCPAEIQPARIPHDALADRTEIYYADAFRVLFPGQPVPPVVGVGCCAQFAVTSATILARPRSDYERYRAWLLATPLPDHVSGRILEYAWHIIFGKPAVHCPPAGRCYCETWGYCNLTCTEDACQGRYTLPPYSTMPEGWPEVGWEGERRGGGREGDGVEGE